MSKSKSRLTLDSFKKSTVTNLGNGMDNAIGGHTIGCFFTLGCPGRHSLEHCHDDCHPQE